MHITPLEISDYEPALALWEAAGLTRPWNDARADLSRAMAGPDSTVLGGYDSGGSLIATAMVGHDGHRGWVYYLAVTLERRGEGHAREMMRACEEWVRDRRIPKIQLMVRNDNLASIGFYEAIGYETSDVAVLGRRLTD
ncbi:GNAT family acetyltransferase [Bogoriella caseilytica]|uniref:Acetyltransferase (GNAT) family protein n=1 Tax=Bogoriella caseilytica TaxID=56055 RepID=A0A3N2BCR3_9MICO|nr:GNAT family acetyltransferase [Bogoriella caseilytica]ROR72854.1 acetyltransferase (GNAT) family protein [Bogoriella caseilytica]